VASLVDEDRIVEAPLGRHPSRWDGEEPDGPVMRPRKVPLTVEHIDEWVAQMPETAREMLAEGPRPQKRPSFGDVRHLPDAPGARAGVRRRAVAR
jgi:hypothetical protein